MKILIMSVPTGGGHYATGKAITDKFKSEGHTAQLVDVYEYVSPLLGESMAKAYLAITKYTPAIYAREYEKCEKKSAERKVQFFRGLNSVIGKAFSSFIVEYKPDVIICTHVMAAQMITSLKKKKLFDENIKTIGIITDFTIHPYWESVDLDYFVTASELLEDQIVKKGMDVSKVKPLGIPVEEKFFLHIDKKEARKMLNIEDKRTVLMMSGSMGYGNIITHLKNLDLSEEEFQVIIVCGNNRKMFNKAVELETTKPKYVFGFTKDVHIMMNAADCIITKPGGLTVSESLAKDLPIIAINPIPGHEYRNLEFLVKNGVAQEVTETYTVDKAVDKLFKNEEELKNVKEKIKKIKKAKAVNDLCEFVLGLDK